MAAPDGDGDGVPTVPTRTSQQIQAEWRALEHVVDQVSDRDDQDAIRDRIDQLRRDYVEATGGHADPEPRPPQQLALPLRFAPYVVAASGPSGEPGTVRRAPTPPPATRARAKRR